MPPPEFDSNLLTATKTLKDFVYQTQQKREIFDLQERYTYTELELPNKNFFFNNYIFNVFLFVTAIISLLVTILVINILCKHKKVKTSVASLALQQIKEVGAVATHETLQHAECTCKIKWYTILMLEILPLGLTMFEIIRLRKLKLFRGHLF